MMLQNVVSFGILLIFANFSFLGGALIRRKRSCGHIRKCLAPFPMLVDLMEKDKAGALVTLTYDVLLDNVCGKQEELSTCLGRTQCEDLQQTLIGDAVQNILSYVCGDGRDALQTEAGCFSRDDFEWGIYQCSKAMELETDMAMIQIQTGVGDNTSFCSVFNDLFKCIHVNVERTCSSRAANFTTNVFAHSVRNLATKIGCSVIFH